MLQNNQKVEKDPNFAFWSASKYFQGQKIIYILPRPYFGTPCISVSRKTGIFLFHCQWFWSSHGSQILEICMCHYAGQIRILWLLLPGAVNCIVLKFMYTKFKVSSSRKLGSY